LTSDTQPHTIVHREHTLPAPPHTAYRAWLEPSLVRRWMA